MATNKQLDILDLGLADYQHVLEQQETLQEQRKEDRIGDTVLLVEHPPVITLGARKADNKLLVTEDSLQQAGIDLVQVRRGGGGTAHNPGQLVFYPILNLKIRRWTITDYIGTLEDIGIALLATLGVSSRQVSGKRGLWVGPRKIASIGVRISRSVTHHGMAINICNDLHIFDHLIPCGLDGVEITSAQKETGVEIAMKEVKQTLVKILNEKLRLDPNSESSLETTPS